jgi:DNA-binding transcriptional regulator PaaX
MLHNIGATTGDKALSLDEITEWTEMDASVVRVHLQRLADLGYIQLIKVDEREKYHLTQSGIRKVLTLYS